MISGYLLRAIMDDRLRRDELRALVLAHKYLDPEEYRPFKGALLGRQLHLQRAHATRALRRLVEFGYLATGPRDGTLITYRLRMPPMCTTGGTSEAA
jgi:hypothetical protein